MSDFPRKSAEFATVVLVSIVSSTKTIFYLDNAGFHKVGKFRSKQELVRYLDKWSDLWLHTLDGLHQNPYSLTIPYNMSWESCL